MGEISTLPNLTSTTAAKSNLLLRVLAAASFCHLLNDMVQSLLPSIYPILKSSFHLNFTQIGAITLTYQITASLLQPFVGYFADRTPRPYALPVGMAFTLTGLLLLAFAPTFAWLLLASIGIGIGSAVFHPEASRIARLASGGRHGAAQSFFQVGGNFGQAIGPLLAAFIVLPRGQPRVAWFALPTILAIFILIWIGRWYKSTHVIAAAGRSPEPIHYTHLPRSQIIRAAAVLIALIFSKFFYIASLTSYYTFYLISHFQVSVRASQELLFLFLAAATAGVFIGGPIGDRYGRKYVIWASILGVLPFTLLLPYVNLVWTAVLSVFIGFILSSAFSAILVYAQELVPGRIGTISGIFSGFAFGMGGIGAAVLGKVADTTSIDHVYRLCAYLPAIGILTWFLPNLEPAKKH